MTTYSNAQDDRNWSGDKSKPFFGQKQAINFRTILDPTLLKKIETTPTPKSTDNKLSWLGDSHMNLNF